MITSITSAWSTPVTLAADEIWQAREGGVFLSVAASPGTDDGILLREGSAVQILSGRSVRYRNAGSGPATVAREAL
jgi:hypothetical protein